MFDTSHLQGSSAQEDVPVLVRALPVAENPQGLGPFQLQLEVLVPRRVGGVAADVGPGLHEEVAVAVHLQAAVCVWRNAVHMRHICLKGTR